MDIMGLADHVARSALLFIHLAPPSLLAPLTPCHGGPRLAGRGGLYNRLYNDSILCIILVIIILYLYACEYRPEGRVYIISWQIAREEAALGSFVNLVGCPDYYYGV